MVYFPTEQYPNVAVEHWADRIGQEYREVEGLVLTLPQVAELWNLTPELCQEVLDRLTSDGVLRDTDDGRYLDARQRACGVLVAA